MAGANGARLRTRIRISPARIGRSSDASISPLSSQPRMVCGDALGQTHRRRRRRRLVQWRPGLATSGLVRLLGRPDSTARRVPRDGRRARIGVARRGEPWRRAGSAKMRSTAASSGSTVRNDRFSGTRRHVSRRRAGLARERLARRGEHGGRRTLKAVDRLLLVADGEQGARLVARAAAGEELLRQRTDHVPLHGARVLRLVDEDVVEAAVELEQHPLDRRQERSRGGACRSDPRNRARRGGPWRACSAAARRRRAACRAIVGLDEREPRRSASSATKRCCAARQQRSRRRMRSCQTLVIRLLRGSPLPVRKKPAQRVDAAGWPSRQRPPADFSAILQVAGRAAQRQTSRTRSKLGFGVSIRQVASISRHADVPARTPKAVRRFAPRRGGIVFHRRGGRCRATSRWQGARAARWSKLPSAA